MPKRIEVCCIVGLGLVVACSSPKPAPPADPSAIPVVAWHAVEVDTFNTRITTAVEAGKTWPEDPILVVRRFLPYGFCGRYVKLVMQSNRVEFPDSAAIEVVEDGFADDSVRGEWHHIALRKLPDGTWRLIEVRRAFRCYRGHQLDTFGERLCL